jgi:histone H3/H4
MAVVKKMKVKRRKRRVDKEIRKQQLSTSHALPRSVFRRLIKETANAIFKDSQLRFQPSACDAIQEDIEARLVSLLRSTGNVCEHEGKETITLKQLRLIMKLTGVEKYMKRKSEVLEATTEETTVVIPTDCQESDHDETGSSESDSDEEDDEEENDNDRNGDRYTRPSTTNEEYSDE